MHERDGAELDVRARAIAARHACPERGRVTSAIGGSFAERHACPERGESGTLARAEREPGIIARAEREPGTLARAQRDACTARPTRPW